MNIDKKYMLEAAVSNDKTRKPLQQIHVPGNGTAVACNATVLAVVPVTMEETDTAGYLNPATLKEARKNKRQNSAFIALNDSEAYTSDKFGRVEVERATVQTIGEYPNIQNVIPADKNEGGFTVTINPDNLLNLSKALGCELVSLTFAKKDGDRRAIVVEPTAGVDSGQWGLIMPCLIKWNY
jgi:hypothetical protein